MNGSGNSPATAGNGGPPQAPGWPGAGAATGGQAGGGYAEPAGYAQGGYPQGGQPGHPQSGQPGYPQPGPGQGGPAGYPHGGQPGYGQAGTAGYPHGGQPGYGQGGQGGYEPQQPGATRGRYEFETAQQQVWPGGGQSYGPQTGAFAQFSQQGGGRGGGTGGPAGPGGSKRGPSGKVIAGWVAGAVVAAVGVGAMIGVLRPSAPGDAAATTTPMATTASTPASPTSTPTSDSPTPTPSPSHSSPSPSPSKSSPSPSPSNTAPITTFVQDPGAAGLDFGIVTGIKRRTDGVIVLTVDRAQFLTGKAAKDYYAAHPGTEPMDYVIVNTNPATRQFTVAPDATLFGMYLLSDHNTVAPVKITMDQLYTRAKPLVPKQPLLVWMQHRGSANGPIGYLAEQFVP